MYRRGAGIGTALHTGRAGLLVKQFVESVAAEAEGGAGQSVGGRGAARACEVGTGHRGGPGVLNGAQHTEAAKRPLGLGREKLAA